MCKHAHNGLGIEATLCGCATVVAFSLRCVLRTIDVKKCLRDFDYKRDDYAHTHPPAKQRNCVVFLWNLEHLLV